MAEEKITDAERKDLDEFGLIEHVPAVVQKEKVETLPPDSRAGDIAIGGMNSQEVLGAAMEILGLNGNNANIKQSQAFKDALARQLANRRPITKHVTPMKKRRWPIAFGPTTVPPMMTITATAQVAALFRGEKLINTGDTTNLMMSSLFVGSKSQLPKSSNPISVKAFSPQTLDSEMLMDTCQPDQSITVQVQNIGGVTQTWSMTLFGHCVT